MSLLDLVFPKRCVNCKKAGDYVCQNCFIYISFDVKPLCLICDRPSFNNLTHPVCRKKYSIDGCFSAIAYNKIAQKLIYNFKYKPYLTDLKTFLSELFVESIIQNENFVKVLEKENFMFTPIPLYQSKLRKRGYNQSEILCKELSESFKLPYQNLLKRVKDTKNQFKLKREDREENVKNAFQLDTKRYTLNAKNIFLVDDIVTTGSTLKEAAKILKRNGANKVFGLTLARD
ncbi:MAG: hypothetical protein COU25_03550 [Candidatus Levybacteria bacterium CG10_big_fil_rev_8_21_14_0_10_35_13]|nr:MAG: hypothetical protein COU25_03550 [Candidatus Levybacteria bacterium CG10_big_fil_rev_8_21_14_0_10_35_13]